MKMICIICEGPTEAKFVKTILRPYFYFENGTIITPITLATSPPTDIAHKGGAINFDRYEDRVLFFLYNENNIVTSMIDFYKLDTDFPAYKESKKVTDIYKKVEFLENAIKEKIGRKVDVSRFLPYIQLHEFEGLLFSDIKGFNAIYGIGDRDLKEIEQIINENPNPELIDDGEETHPAKRLLKIVRGYRKKVYGNMIAEKIGIETIMSKCPHFKEWVEKLVEMSKT